MSRGSLGKTEKTFGTKNAGRFFFFCQPLSIATDYKGGEENPSY